MNKKKIAIIGAGGHGKVIGEIALLNNYKKINFFDDGINQIKQFDFSIVGNLETLKENIRNYDDFFVAIGDNYVRYKLLKWLKKEKLNIVNLIHPKSTVSSLSFLEVGISVMANAVINPGTFIGEGAIINTSASIDHDCLIENFSHISPNCSLSGNVKVCEFTHLGTGTVVHPGIKIGRNVKTAVGSKVFKNILDNKIYKS